MKNLTKIEIIALVFFILVILSSCRKEANAQLIGERAPKDTAYTLTFKFTLGDSLHNFNLVSTDIRADEGFENGHNIRIGDFVTFRAQDFMLNFFYEYGKGVTQGGGNISDHSFIFFAQDSAINICNGEQGLPVVYSLTKTLK